MSKIISTSVQIINCPVKFDHTFPGKLYFWYLFIYYWTQTIRIVYQILFLATHQSWLSRYNWPKPQGRCCATAGQATTCSISVPCQIALDELPSKPLIQLSSNKPVTQQIINSPSTCIPVTHMGDKDEIVGLLASGCPSCSCCGHLEMDCLASPCLTSLFLSLFPSISPCSPKKYIF